MPEIYSKPFQISKMMRNTENPNIVRKVYSGIFINIQRHSAILTYVQANIPPYSGMLKNFQTLLWYIEPYSEPYVNLRHLQKPVKLTDQAYSEPWHSQNSSFKYFQEYLGIFRNIDAYSAIQKQYSFCKMFHLSCLTVFWTRLCLDNCSVICTKFCQMSKKEGLTKLVKRYNYSSTIFHFIRLIRV